MMSWPWIQFELSWVNYREHHNSSSLTILTVFCSEISWQSLVLGIGSKWWRQNLPWSTSWFDLMITRRKEKVLYYNHCQFRGVLEECTYILHRITCFFFSNCEPSWKSGSTHVKPTSLLSSRLRRVLSFISWWSHYTSNLCCTCFRCFCIADLKCAKIDGWST